MRTISYTKKGDAHERESASGVSEKVGDVVADPRDTIWVSPSGWARSSKSSASADHVHFRVRWDDDRESIFYPGSDATVRVHRRKREVKKP